MPAREAVSAVDPITRKGLEQFEKLFQQFALNIETVRDIERRRCSRAANAGSRGCDRPESGSE